MRVAIIGGSLAGLAAANVFHRLGFTVIVYEKSSQSFQSRGSSLGFVDVNLWEKIRGETMMRFGRRAGRDQGAYFYGDLWSFLYAGLPEGCVKFDRMITDLGEDKMRPTIDGEVFDLAIIADGGWSSLRHYVNGDKLPEYSGYVIWRAKTNLNDVPGFQGEGAHTSGQYFIMALNIPTCAGPRYVMGGVAIETPEDEVSRPDDGSSRHTEIARTEKLPEWFMPFIHRHFGNHANGEVVRWLESCASKGKITAQPLFEFMAENVVSGRLILIGDAAHMASPRTAAGAHTGILDAFGLLEAFTTHPGVDHIDEAIQCYEPGGKLRASELYKRSKEVGKDLLSKK